MSLRRVYRAIGSDPRGRPFQLPRAGIYFCNSLLEVGVSTIGFEGAQVNARAD